MKNKNNMKKKINRKSQVGILLETFIMMLILIMFLLFWGGYSRTTFLAGIFKIDDSALRHTCSNIAPLVAGTEYIKSSAGTNEPAVTDLFTYLGFDKQIDPVPDANYFFKKIETYFPELKGNVYITVVRSDGQKVPSAGTKKSGAYLGVSGLSKAECEFPLYSTNKSLTARVIMEVYI